MSDRLAMIELLARDGSVAHRVPVMQWPVRIGRAIDCDVVLDDPHAAPCHALLEAGDAAGSARLEVGDTLNGLRLAGRLLTAGEHADLHSGATWQIGRSSLRLRLADEALAPEQLLDTPPPVRPRWLAAGLLLMLAWLLAERWLQSDPGDPLASYLPVMVGAPLVLALWCFVWALGSKVFTGHFDFLPHLRVALGVLLASLLLETLLPLAAFATSWEGLARLTGLLPLALGTWLLHSHLSLILPTRRQALAVGLVTMFVVGSGLQLLLQYQRSDRWFEPLYLDTLGPPALRVAPTLSPEDFLAEAARLRAPLEAHARDRDRTEWVSGDDEAE